MSAMMQRTKNGCSFMTILVGGQVALMNELGVLKELCWKDRNEVGDFTHDKMKNILKSVDEGEYTTNEGL